MHIPTAIILSFILIYNHAALGQTPLGYVIAICIADGITAIAYLLLKNRGKQLTSFRWGFFISGIALLSLYFTPYGTAKNITIAQAAIIGVAQALALSPGISRLALTCTTGIWLGIDPLIAVLFSLSAELALILVALSKVAYEVAQNPLLRSEYRAFFTLSLWQLCILGCSTLLSYGLLWLVISSFIHKTIAIFGFYLLILTLFMR